MSAPLPREAYEATGGWRDGRLGQVYDLLWDIIKDRGAQPFRHPLLAQIEAMDQEEIEA